MSELNYASTLAALDGEFASASASTGSGSVPVGRYNAMIKEAKIVARTGGGLALSVSFVVTEGEYKGRYAFTSYGLHKNGLPYFKGFLQTIQLPLERLSELEQILPQFTGRRCAINVQTDKQNPQYTRTYVDKYLGMGDIHEVLGASAPAADAEGFTPAEDDGDMPF